MVPSVRTIRQRAEMGSLGRWAGRDGRPSCRQHWTERPPLRLRNSNAQIIFVTLWEEDNLWENGNMLNLS